MIQNYLKLSLRHLASHRYFTLINILGLGCGIAAMVWAFQTYRFSFSFDDFQPDRDQIFRLVSYKEASPERKGIVPFPMIEAARQEMAGIAESMRYEDIRLTVKADQGESFQELIQFVDPTFFSFFNFPLLEGSPDISDPSGIVITEKMAEKYFGKRENYREILGKTLNLYAGEAHQMPMTIKGVLKNPPMNSAFQLMNAVTNFQNIRLPDGHPLQADAWDWFLGAAFFRLKQPAESATIAKALEKYIPLQNKARQDWKITGFELISMRDHARMDDIDANYLMGRPEDSAAYGPLVMAFLLLLSACLNFANTMVSRSNRRLKEMGIRKVLGGSRSQLIRQMLLECAAVVILAIGLSMLINRWWIPAFNRMFVFTDAQTDYLHDPILLLFLGCTLFFTTLLAGGYPAFYLSRFNPNSIFRGSVKFGGNNWFSRILLGFQVMISIITIVAGFGFARNAKFQEQYDYGFNHSRIIVLPFNDVSELRAMESKLATIPEVAQYAGTRHHLGFSYVNRVIESLEQKHEVDVLSVGDQYLDVMEVELLEGRPFDPNLATDFERSLLVTEKFNEVYGWTNKDALGQQVKLDTNLLTIVGILKNIHNDNLFDPTQPVGLRLVKPERYTHLVLKAQTGQLTHLFDEVKTAWVGLFPNKPFTGYYQSELTAETLRVTSNIAKIFSWFSIIALLLTVTGLFALVSLTVLKKMKEIAVRRVVGASPGQIMTLINKGYLWVFVVGVIGGTYVGFVLTRLLMDMIFRVNSGINLSVLIGSGFAVLAIALLTVGVKTWQALRSNPADVLKSE